MDDARRRDHATPAVVPVDRLDAEQDPAAIEARFRWARAQGHPRYLWPDVPLTAWRAALDEIERATRLVLLRSGRAPSGAGTGAPATLSARGDPRALGIAAFTSGMGPLLGYWLEIGEIEADADASAVLRLQLDHARERNRRMHATLRHALQMLEAAGPVTVVKGAATAPMYFPDPGTRPSSDIDLIVPRDQMGRAWQALRNAGYTPLADVSTPAPCDWAPPDAPRTLRSVDLVHRDNPYTIDLHDRLGRAFFGVRSVELPFDMERHTRPWPELGPSARVPEPDVHAAFLALHASEELEHLQLLRLVELVLLSRHEAPRIPELWSRVEELLLAADALRFAYPALTLVQRLAPGTLPEDFARRLEAAATPRMRRVLSRIGPATAQRPERLALDERFIWARGPVEHVRRAVYLLWPTTSGRPVRPPGGLYLERLFRVLRGRIRLRGPQQ